MKFTTRVWPAGLVLLIFGVQEACSLSGVAGLSTFFLAIMSGFLLGTFTLSTFIMLLMAVTPPEGRALHKRGIRSVVETNLTASLVDLKNESISFHQSRRLDGRFLQNLIAQDPLNCLPQLLCSAASSPSTKAEDIINDYQFLMKEVLQQASGQADGKENSGYHNIYSKLESYNNNDAEEEEKESDEKESDEELDKIFDLMALKEKSEIEDQMYSELVEDDPDNLGFVMAEMNEKRKRSKLRKTLTTTKPPWLYDEDIMKVVQDPDLKKIFERFKPRLSRNLNIFREKLEGNKEIQTRNPRMEKLAFFSRKQRELKQAVSTDEKFRIATDVGQKYRSGRQCRRLFNTCPFQPNTLSRLVNNLRRVLTGTPTNSNKLSGSLTNNGQGSNSIVSTATKPSTNVQVVVNLGSELQGLGGKQGIPATSAPLQNYQSSAPAPLYQQPLLHIPISVPNAFTKAPTQIPTPAPTVNYQNFMNTLILPSPTPVPSKMQPFYAQYSPMKYQIPTSQDFPLLYTTRRTTTPAPTTATIIKTVKPVAFSTTEADSLITKPFLEDFLNFFNITTTQEPMPVFPTSEPINTYKLPPKKVPQKSKPSSGENFGYSFSRPMTQSSTTTEKGYLLPMGFDVDPGTRTISSSLTSSEFVTTTLAEGLQEDGTWMPLEHIFTHPTEGTGSEFVLHRQPPSNSTTLSGNKKSEGATFHFQHQSSAEKTRSPVPVQSPVEKIRTQAPFQSSKEKIRTTVPIPVTVAPKITTISPQRIAAEAFLQQIMSGHHSIFPSSTTIFTTTAKPKIFTEYTNKPKPSFHVPPEDYLKELETVFKLVETPGKKIEGLKTNSRFPTTTEAEQRESDELLTFIRNMEKQKLRSGTEKPPKSNPYRPVPVTEDPDMKEIDEVIKLLDEQSKEESEENEPPSGGRRPGKPKKRKTKLKGKPNIPSPLPTKTTTTTTSTTSAPGIISDMNEVINLLNNEEKKPKLSRSRKANGSNRRNSKITRKRKRKPKPSSEESSEEDYENVEENELPPSFINRYRKIQLRRPLIAVPYRTQRQDSDEDDLPPKPPSPVQKLTSGVYQFLFSGINNKNNLANKPPRYLPLQQKQHVYRNQFEDEEERPYIPKQYRHQVPEFRHEYRTAPRIPSRADIRKNHVQHSFIFRGGY